VTAYTVYRTVRCSICGALLDPFDVLVEMLKSHVSPNGGTDEERRFQEEASRRSSVDGDK
jgi:hypothetical protein